MWTVTAHQPTGNAAERFDTEDAARRRANELLAAGRPVTIDPVGDGLPLPRWCVFCGKPQATVARLVAGPAGAGVAICDACVALCAEIFRDDPAVPPRQAEPRYL
jgi:hypothetical protein